jgi:hypothetical protein
VKNRILGAALAAALSAPAALMAKGLTTFGALLKAQGIGSETGTNDPRSPRINRRRGYSAAHGKRMARKRRNQLRAKGLHRQAVR